MLEEEQGISLYLLNSFDQIFEMIGEKREYHLVVQIRCILLRYAGQESKRLA
jgi:hypothetical protein